MPRMSQSPKKKPARNPAVDAKQKVADKPTRDDVHEQREPAQTRQGVVHRSTQSPPAHGR
jgi:hypothetical protein